MWVRRSKYDKLQEDYDNVVQELYFHKMGDWSNGFRGCDKHITEANIARKRAERKLHALEQKFAEIHRELMRIKRND